MFPQGATFFVFTSLCFSHIFVYCKTQKPTPFLNQTLHRKRELSKDNAYWRKYSVSTKKKELLKQSHATNKTISVIIPSYHKHAFQLYSLVRMYENQTRLPDEVVISLSEATFVEATILDQLKNELWAFPVTLIISPKKKYAAENRNIACAHAKGDVFLCQDADDIPHPRRVEVVHYFFSTYTIDHLMHRYRMIALKDSTIPFDRYAHLDQIQFTNFRDFDVAKNAGQLTNGNIAIARHVFDAIQWPIQPRAEDVPFNKGVYKKFRKCIVIRAILYGYRQFLSSTNEQINEGKIQLPAIHNAPKKCYQTKIVNLNT